MKEKVNPIKQELRPLLEEFLVFEEYQPIFKAFAENMGYKGDDPEKIRNGMFYVNKNKDIIFNIDGLYDLFLEFQLLKQLKEKEPYKTLLSTNPKSITKLRELAKKIFKGETITNDDLKKLFSYGEKEETRGN